MEARQNQAEIVAVVQAMRQRLDQLEEMTEAKDQQSKYVAAKIDHVHGHIEEEIEMMKQEVASCVDLNVEHLTVRINAVEATMLPEMVALKSEQQGMKDVLGVTIAALQQRVQSNEEMLQQLAPAVATAAADEQENHGDGNDDAYNAQATGQKLLQFQAQQLPQPSMSFSATPNQFSATPQQFSTTPTPTSDSPAPISESSNQFAVPHQFFQSSGTGASNGGTGTSTGGRRKLQGGKRKLR